MSGLGAEAFGVNPVSTDCPFSDRVVWGFLLMEEQVPPPVRGTGCAHRPFSYTVDASTSLR